ncbi:cobyric acid synthase [Aneurinibacillus aneurinilyticus]|uniref:cobyric acid synthase n=1 Tax=Aneurinibacillus aneurinilyticus TaxID=1391 RepID=UPI002E1ECDD1|nr:cobyric acid synthase [Aneurinibacillus aneurinilyticus]MED0670917.1 cobyric acid synthase [Aneurinibacillus aneurinilyticus]
MKAIMLQGTSSDVGKSVLCTALCRILYEDGWKVAPFKSQNMALNSYITRDGKEIGRAQGVQAEACRIEATADMNPILLKPKQDMIAEVIVRGEHYADMGAGAYRSDYVPTALPVLRESLDRLAEEYEVLVMEGAGSPAEINLKDRDIANMKAAELADAPVLLIADIDRGGVFASLVGTLALLDDDERARVKGFIINKFRGKFSLLKSGLDWLEEHTGLPVLGVIPYADTGIDAEDSLALSTLRLKKQDENGEALNVAVIRLPRISNFTDIDPLYDEPGVRMRLIASVAEWNNPDIIILPGTKNTTDDLQWLKQTGLADVIGQAAQGGAYVVGICGGYQMLGKELYDPDGIESTYERSEGLGLLPIHTTFQAGKRTIRVEGEVCGVSFATGQTVTGYEIHLGQTMREQGSRPLFRLDDGHTDGAVADGEAIWGTYLHGVFHNREFTRAWLNRIRLEKGMEPIAGGVHTESERREASYAALASLVREHLDMKKLYDIIGLPLPIKS